VHFHYTPTHASWLNLVECFSSILGKQGLSQSVHTSKRQRKEFLLSYIAHNNRNPRPFVWTKDRRSCNTSSRRRSNIRRLTRASQGSGAALSNTINN